MDTIDSILDTINGILDLDKLYWTYIYYAGHTDTILDDTAIWTL